MTRCIILLLLALPAWTHAAPLIAPTEPLTPDQQIKKFHLPTGFEIQLVASEPDIQKPMNMNFDTRGRLWVTHSVEYPFPAKDADKARDGLTILSNFAKDGKAKTITRFADKLNIPIGVQPMNRGNAAIVWSIPNIWKITETDGDGKADKREILYGPFGVDDTHGNQNAFTLGPDGWIYACHGFRNHSKIKLRGKGKVVLELQSGNTYRFKPDGTAIEQFTHGQVNPFGLCFDPNGDLFSADCHSKPVTMLLRGGYYPSFGKPHDGLGFAPQTTKDDHGSTGIAGIAYVQGETFPREYNNCLYIGNPITNKVHRDVLRRTGSTYRVEQPLDFLTCADPWFRPVDIQWGPDGALYIADFYNCIIGHYEVDLHHPKRDRERGRIWRVVYSGGDRRRGARRQSDLIDMSSNDLGFEMRHSNLTRRTLALRELIRRGRSGDVQVKQIADLATRSKVIDGPPRADTTITPQMLAFRSQGIWLSERIALLAASRIAPLSFDHTSVRRQLIKALSNRSSFDGATTKLIQSELRSQDTILQRFAADALARHPGKANIMPLLAGWKFAHPKDTFLIHSIRISLREQLRALPADAKLDDISLSADDLKRLVEISLAVPTEQAAWFTFEYLRQNKTDASFMQRCMAHVANHLPTERVDDIAAFVRERFEADIAKQWTLFAAIQTGLDKRAVQPKADSAMGQWLTTLVPQLLKTKAQPMWTHHPLERGGKSPWGLRERKCADGQTALFIDSIVNGEQLTGALRSHSFKMPAKLSFYLCGHNGFPGKKPQRINQVRLIIDGKVVASQGVPRNDTARKYTWDFPEFMGKQATIEIVDVDAAAAYAWIGVARFEPAVVSVAGFSKTATKDRSVAVIEQVGGYRLEALSPTVAKRLSDKDESAAVRIAAAQALSRMNNLDATAINTIVDMMRTSPATEQRQFAQVLCATQPSASALLDAIDQGHASPRLLQDVSLAEQFKKVATGAMQSRAVVLMKRVPDLDKELVTLIQRRRAGYTGATPNNAAGKTLFAKHCAACHRVGEIGATIAPALDGMKNRGADRLIEDILDPNRNVDQAFRTVIIDTKDGGTLTGFGARTEGKTLVLNNLQGKAVRIATTEIDGRRGSTHSPMPGNFGQLMTDREFFDLVGYLLEQ